MHELIKLLIEDLADCLGHLERRGTLLELLDEFILPVRLQLSVGCQECGRPHLPTGRAPL